MQPVITIPGNFWDSQIYAGKLYLFGWDGDIRTLDWDRLINEWPIDDNHKFALKCAFARSDLLYGDRWTIMSEDDEIKKLIQKKFNRISKVHLDLPEERLDKFTIARQANLFPIPHADSSIYGRNLFIASRSGLYRVTCGRGTKYPLSTKVYKVWDCPLFAISPLYGTLALAAGDEGLYEFSINGNYVHENQIKQHNSRNCTDCSWVYYSIYGSSHIDDGFLAAYVKERDEAQGMLWSRRFDRLVSSNEIFQNHGYSWGTKDKIYQVSDNKLQVVKYEPRSEEPQGIFSKIGVIDLQSEEDGIVAGDSTLFGTIIEFNSSLKVLTSDGNIITITGEPVSWRTFIRSKHYENHLHIIYDDRLEIWSFNHDYFIDQQKKVSGIEYRNYEK